MSNAAPVSPARGLIRPVLIGCTSDKISNLETWAPATPAEVFFWVTLDIDVPGWHEPKRIYSLSVATPEAMAQRGNGRFAGPGQFIKTQYSWDNVRTEIDRRLAACEATTPTEVHWKLAHHFGELGDLRCPYCGIAHAGGCRAAPLQRMNFGTAASPLRLGTQSGAAAASSLSCGAVAEKICRQDPEELHL